MRVVIGVPDLAAAAAMYRELLDAITMEAGDDVCELAWPGGGRIRLEGRPGRAAVDRLEVEGLDRDYDVLGTRFTPAA